MENNLLKLNLHLDNLEDSRLDNDEQIPDDFFIYFYKGFPLYIDFLKSNKEKKAAEYFDKIKSNLTVRKWGEMKESDKIHYLYNKIQYYNMMIEQKEESKNKFIAMIGEKNKQVKKLKELVNEKEPLEEKSDNNQADLIKKKENIEKLEKQMSEFPHIIAELDDKIKNSDELILNYENPSTVQYITSPADGLPITEIIEHLKEEKSTLKADIIKQNEYLLELDERIKQLNTSIKILEMKSTPNKTNSAGSSK